MNEKAITGLCLKHIKTIIPDIEKRLVGSSILKTPFAYPVFLKKYEKERLDFERSTNIDNLLSIGRNGEFAHRFMEDVYWRTRKKIQDFLSNQSSNKDIRSLGKV